MEDLFSYVCDEVGNSRNRIFAFHNGVVDVVYEVPLTKDEYKEKLDLGEQRFNGKKTVRIGGGGINFALTAAAVGAKGITFVGFMDGEAHALVESIKSRSGIDFPMIWTETGPRRNTILELKDLNILYHDPETASEASPEKLIAKLNLLKASAEDWLASCSFYEKTTFPLLDYGKRLFIDSGYGYPRREKALLTSLCPMLRSRQLAEVIIGANETELHNIADEFGSGGGALVHKARFASDRISERSATNVKILLHTASFSSLVEPGMGEPWVMPCLDTSVLRRTNAGDTFAGAFMAAYNATGNPCLSCFFANAATAKRLATDDLPCRQSMAEFLKRAGLKKADADARQIGLDDLRLARLLGSSACLRASPAGARPPAQILR